MTEPTTPGDRPPRAREFHPATELFPLLRGPAFDKLVSDIRDHGLREPILCDPEDRILDGRNRYRACLQAGVEPRFVTFHGNGSPLDLILRVNLLRRHLTTSQRAMVAARLAYMAAPAAKKRRGRPRKITAKLQRISLGSSARRAAALVGVSERLVNSAAAVLKLGSPALVSLVDSGQIKVSTALPLAALPTADQERIVAAGPHAAAQKARELRPPEEPVSDVSFGLRSIENLGPGMQRDLAGDDAIALLWVSLRGFDTATAILKKHGFRYVS